MKILKCDVCGYTQSPEKNNDRDDFYDVYLDKQKYDLCNTCKNEYRQLLHELTAAFIFYPDRKIKIEISKEQYAKGGAE